MTHDKREWLISLLNDIDNDVRALRCTPWWRRKDKLDLSMGIQLLTAAVRRNLRDLEVT